MDGQEPSNLRFLDVNVIHFSHFPHVQSNNGTVDIGMDISRVLLWHVLSVAHSTSSPNSPHQTTTSHHIPWPHNQPHRTTTQHPIPLHHIASPPPDGTAEDWPYTPSIGKFFPPETSAPLPRLRARDSFDFRWIFWFGIQQKIAYRNLQQYIQAISKPTKSFKPWNESPPSFEVDGCLTACLLIHIHLMSR